MQGAISGAYALTNGWPKNAIARATTARVALVWLSGVEHSRRSTSGDVRAGHPVVNPFSSVDNTAIRPSRTSATS
jgi:hypothetical protein